MKKLCWLLILVLVIGCFTGCSREPAVPDQPTEPRPIENPDGTLADWMKEEILAEWIISGKQSFGGWMEDGTGIARYYGITEGFVIIFMYNGLAWEQKTTIGSYSFSCPTGFDLYVYKDKTFYKLEEIYEEGFISDEAIQLAWEIHQEYQEKG